VSLDDLIAYVRSLHPDGGPLDNVADAVTVSARLDEQSDALLGHFVDQARRSGASWTQIGSHLGVSKQAARKRFVLRWDGSDPIPDGQMFSRFTPCARNTLVAAGRVAERAGAQVIDAAHLAVALLNEPEGLAAKIIHGAGLSDEQVCVAFELVPVQGQDEQDEAAAAALGALRFTDAGEAALQGSVKAALRLGHHYIGTEHLLLGLLGADGPDAETLMAIGLSVESVERALADEIAKIQAQRRVG